MAGREFNVAAEWDSDGSVWVATSSDVAGLVVQGETPDDIVRRVRMIIPALIETGVETRLPASIAKLRALFKPPKITAIGHDCDFTVMIQVGEHGPEWTIRPARSPDVMEHIRSIARATAP